MEEHVWLLVELFISGKATETQINELTYLLGTHPYLLNTVKEFLDEYQDPDPQITTIQKRALILKAKNISNEFAYVNQPRIARGISSTFNFTNSIKQESRTLIQLFKTTFRQLRHNKAISFINISGLAIGMATAILIFLWVANELSYDRFHTNKDRIYGQTKINGQLQASGALPSILAPVLKANYSQVEEADK